ncbi:MAG TPA: ThuA domain-containing protein [Nocardioidaceae bacterium]|jgi:type 1 glutamine amidotransferase
MKRTAVKAVAGLAALASAVLSVQCANASEEQPQFDALVFSKTAGYRHASIPDGIAAIQKLGEEHNFTVTATEDASAFNDQNLSKYEVVIWLSTTGDVLNDDQQAAFERYIENGGGYAGVHAASDTEYTWPWYGDLVGSYFNGHPAQQWATVKVAGQSNPATAELPNRWHRWDEWYNFRTDPTGKVRVLARMDESSYDAGTTAMGDSHPISWCHRYDGGRAWYTGMGHTSASYTEPLFLSHLLGGIEEAAGAAKFNCDPEEASAS